LPLHGTVNLSANYLSLLLTHLTHIEPPLNALLNTAQQRFPLLSATVVQARGDQPNSPSSLQAAQTDPILKQYAEIEYDLLSGKQYALSYLLPLA